MAQRVTTTYVSDLSGEEISNGSPTVFFSFDGKAYSVDLTTKEAEKMQKVLQPYLDVAKSAAGFSGATSPKATRSASNASEVREWAVAQGLTVPERGRLPKEVKEAYNAAH